MMTDKEARDLLSAAMLPGYLWQLPDVTYEAVSDEWVLENWAAWLEARPPQLVVWGDAGGKTVRVRPLWISEACDCDNLGLGVVAHAQVGNALSAQKTRLPRGGVLFGFLFYTAEARPDNYGVVGPHCITWSVRHDGAVRFFEPGMGAFVELNETERRSACFGFAS